MVRWRGGTDFLKNQQGQPKGGEYYMALYTLYIHTYIYIDIIYIYIFCGTEGSLLWFLELSEHFLEYRGSRLA